MKKKREALPKDPPTLIEQLLAIADRGHPRASELREHASHYQDVRIAYYNTHPDIYEDTPARQALLDAHRQANRLREECTVQDLNMPETWAKALAK